MRAGSFLFQFLNHKLLPLCNVYELLIVLSELQVALMDLLNRLAIDALRPLCLLDCCLKVLNELLNPALLLRFGRVIIGGTRVFLLPFSQEFESTQSFLAHVLVLLEVLLILTGLCDVTLHNRSVIIFDGCLGINDLGIAGFVLDTSILRGSILWLIDLVFELVNPCL